MQFERDRVLAFVKRSPALVAAHDKQGWTGLFAPFAVVEDPVGGLPARKGESVHDGDDELGRFYDVFIAPNEIVFEVHRDVVLGPLVARDVTISTRTPNGSSVVLPAYLIYETTEVEGELFVRRMRAFWEIRRVTGSALRRGLKTMIAMSSLSLRMLRFQGGAGVGRYLEGLWRGMFERGHEAVGALSRSIEARDEQALLLLFSSDSPCIAVEPGKLIRPTELFAALGPNAEFLVDAPISSGFFTMFRLKVRALGQTKSGMGLCGFDEATRRISSLELFIEGKE